MVLSGDQVIETLPGELEREVEGGMEEGGEIVQSFCIYVWVVAIQVFYLSFSLCLTTHTHAHTDCELN